MIPEKSGKLKAVANNSQWISGQCRELISDVLNAGSDTMPQKRIMPIPGRTSET